MAEETPAETTEDKPTEEAAETTEEPKEETPEAPAPEGGEEGEEGEGEGEGEETPEATPEPPKVAPEPTVRKSRKDFIIERKTKKIEKLEEGEAPAAEEGEETPTGDVQKQVEESIKPLASALRGQIDDTELEAVYSKYPKAKEMEKDIKKYMEHPAYANVPVEFIYLGIAGQVGGLSVDAKAALKKEADKEAVESGTGGAPKGRKGLPALPDFSKMSLEEIEAVANKVKSGQTI